MCISLTSVFPKQLSLAFALVAALDLHVSASLGSRLERGLRGVQAGAGRAEPSSCLPLSPSLMARLIKNHINSKIVHVVLNQFEVSVRIK